MQTSSNYVGRERGGASVVNRQLFGWPPQCLRRRFAENRPVSDGKASKLPEAMVGDNTRDACFARVCTTKGATHEMHSPQGQIAYRPHAQMFFTRRAERSLGDTDSPADFCEIKRTIGMGRQIVLELCNDR